ncbi:hypothetical protein QE152_g23771 [Popillia japonica]|uniref:Uncharacterized protein n=1 Tax=Popillia japonica TaxID=7064 RepID=A0AAW1KCX6_POPJA
MENFDELMRFSEIFKPIVETPEEIKPVKDIGTFSKAQPLLRAIITNELIVSILTASSLFAFTLPLSRILQSINLDLSVAVEHMDTIINQTKKMTVDIDQVFSHIFEEAQVYTYL